MGGRTRTRVALLVHTAQVGGAERALLRLVTAVDRELFDVQVVLFADGPLADALRAAAIEVTVVELDPRVARAERGHLGRLRALRGVPRTLGFLVRLTQLLRSGGFHVVHANSLKSGVLGAIASAPARLPLVWYLHDRISADYLPPVVGRGVRLLLRLRARVVIANSESTRATLGLPDGADVLVAHPGLPDACFDVRPKPLEPPRFGMIGRVSPTKGQHVFLRAAASVRADRPDLRFAVVGAALFNESDYERDMHRLVRRLGLDDVVEFAGYLPDTEPYLTGLTALVHASPVPEPFGQVIVEAMAAGVPVIATRGGGVTEILGEHGECGLLVPPGDAPALASAMLEVLDHPDDAAARARRARARARAEFGIGRTVDLVTGAWRRAADGTRPAGGGRRQTDRRSQCR